MNKMENLNFESEFLKENLGKFINEKLDEINESQEMIKEIKEAIQKSKDTVNDLENKKKTENQYYKAYNETIQERIEKEKTRQENGEKKIAKIQKDIEQKKNEIKKVIEKFKEEIKNNLPVIKHKIRLHSKKEEELKSESSAIKRTITGLKQIDGKKETYQALEIEQQEITKKIAQHYRKRNNLFELHMQAEESLIELDTEVIPKLSDFLEIKTPKQKPAKTEPEKEETEATKQETEESEKTKSEGAEPEVKEQEKTESEVEETETEKSEKKESEVEETEAEKQEKKESEVEETEAEKSEKKESEPANNAKVDKFTVAKIDVNVKNGLYTLTMKSGDKIEIPTRKFQNKEKEEKAAKIREQYGISMEMLDPDKVKDNMRDAAKNISGYGINDKRTDAGEPFEKTGLVDPIIASILVSFDYELEKINTDLKNTNKSKYGKFILGQEQETEEKLGITYDYKEVKKVKNKDMIKSMKYLEIIGKNAKNAQRKDMLENYNEGLISKAFNATQKQASKVGDKITGLFKKKEAPALPSETEQEDFNTARYEKCLEDVKSSTTKEEKLNKIDEAIRKDGLNKRELESILRNTELEVDWQSYSTKTKQTEEEKKTGLFERLKRRFSRGKEKNEDREEEFDLEKVRNMLPGIENLKDNEEKKAYIGKMKSAGKITVKEAEWLIEKTVVNTVKRAENNEAKKTVTRDEMIECKKAFTQLSENLESYIKDMRLKGMSDSKIKSVFGIQIKKFEELKQQHENNEFSEDYKKKCESLWTELKIEGIRSKNSKTEETRADSTKNEKMEETSKNKREKFTEGLQDGVAVDEEKAVQNAAEKGAQEAIKEQDKGGEQQE